MHEAKLCLSLIELAQSALAREGGVRITALRVEVGVLSGVESRALAAAFPICAAGSVAEGALLQLETVAGRELRLCDMEVL